MSKRVVITSSVELVSVAPENIVYVSAEGNYSIMTLVDKSQFTFSFNLQKFGEKLVEQLQADAGMFIRIGKSLIVNRDYILRINPQKQMLVLATEKMDQKFNLSASKEALRQVKSLIESDL